MEENLKDDPWESTQSSVERECKDFAESNGFVVRKTGADGKSYVQMGALTTYPSKIPAPVYEQALDCQSIYNELYHKIAHDYDFLKDTLRGTVENDDFIRRLWEIYDNIRGECCMQKVSLGLLRSDYMIHVSEDGRLLAKQVEMNTIACSMAGLSRMVGETHRYIMSRVRRTNVDIATFPKNTALTVLANGLHKAFLEYRNPRAIILFLVHRDEANFSDIRKLQYELMSFNPELRVKYADFNILKNHAVLSTENYALRVAGEEVAIVYYRYGYAPDHYVTEEDWNVRLIIERSKAVKCPSISYHLAGCKTVQQQLTLPGVLEQFLTAQQAEKLRETFVSIYSLSKEAGGDAIMSRALQHTSDYVLKPQREGGGNNYYNDDITVKWNEVKDTQEREAYILMDRIKPPAQRNCMIPCDFDCCDSVPMISELGIYGAVLGQGCCVTHNESGGYLLRTKCVDTNEGGFFCGCSAIDTPQLVSAAQTDE